jgi:hypothetical protein
MHCTKCGAELAPETKFCVTCGTPVAQMTEAAPVAPVVTETPVQQEAAPVATAAPEKEGVKIDVNEVKDQLVATVKPLWDKVKPFLQNKKVLFGIGAVVLLLIVASVISAIFSGGNGFIQREQSIKLEYAEETISIIVDGKLQKTTIDDVEASEYGGGNYSTTTSLNGKVVAVNAYSEDENTLYVINGKKLLEVDEDVTSYQLSISGKAVAYLTRNEDEEGPITYTLSLYTISNKKTVTISDEVASRTFAISPDGKSVAYFESKENDEDEIEYILMYSNGKDSTKITSAECELLGMGNGGKYIYAACENDEGEASLYSYDKKGERTKLGKISGSTVCYNADHSQVMFSNEGKTYISTKGKEAVKAHSNAISMLTPSNASYVYDRSGITYPVSNLYDHVYAVSDESGASVWLIKKNSDKNVKLVSKVTDGQLDDSAEYLYYEYDNEELRMIKISDGEKASDRYITLAEDIDSFWVTSDRKYVYYTSDDCLYSVNGKKGGKPTTVCNDEIEDAAMNGKDVFYYILDGDLYATKNGKKGSKVLGDITSLSSTLTGIVYAENEDTLYVSTGSKKPKKLMDKE